MPVMVAACLSHTACESCRPQGLQLSPGLAVRIQARLDALFLRTLPIGVNVQTGARQSKNWEQGLSVGDCLQ